MNTKLSILCDKFIEAGWLAARAGVSRLMLTHFYPPCDEVDVVALAGTQFAGEIIRAEDGLIVKL